MSEYNSRMRVMVTGGAGFIGSHFVKRQQKSTIWEEIIVLDSLTYAGNLDNLGDSLSDSKVKFVRGDICDSKLVEDLTSGIDVIVNFAAESHVDRSLMDGSRFIQTNVSGTTNLLKCALKNKVRIFHQVSTDEVYGSISEGSWDENFPLDPNSPYSASKASADLVALAFHKSYDLDVRISRCSNNYGPNQHPEKLIPLAITNLISNKHIPIYGDGKNRRDWLHVEDHCSAIESIISDGDAGEIYNIGGGIELTNLQVAEKILQNFNLDFSEVEFVKDRLGHDFRYSVNWNKLASKTGYSPKHNFDQALAETVEWYRANPKWWRVLRSENSNS